MMEAKEVVRMKSRYEMRVFILYGHPGQFIVTSESQPHIAYLVNPCTGRCSCPGNRFHGHCKHVERVRALIEESVGPAAEPIPM